MDVLGVAAVIASCAGFVPQLLKVIRSRDAAGVSTRMYMLTCTAFLLWIVYSIGLGAWMLVISNAICLALAGSILLITRLRRDDTAARDGAMQPFARSRR